MSKIYRSAKGKSVDMDLIRLKNESSIAIGNAGTNARGDKLGSGGKVVKTRNELMRDYHTMNTPVAENAPVQQRSAVKEPVVADVVKEPVEPVLKTPVPKEAPVQTSKKTTKKPRGKLADSIANKK